MSEKQPVKPTPPPRLPFEKRPSDIGSWSYDHRVGLCVTVIVFLLTGIIFISTKVAFGNREFSQRFYIDLSSEVMEEVQEIPQETPEEQRERLAQMDFSDVRNRISNENATNEQGLNDRLRDASRTNASEIYEEAAAAQAHMQANRNAYERGQRENAALLTQNTSPAESGNQPRQDAKVKGRVTVSFSLNNPLRNSEKLIVPAYLCEGGGQVVVSIIVDRSGYVTAATVDRSASSTDACMLETAVSAARQSRFNLDPSAPEKHSGTITYLFIPQ